MHKLFTIIFVFLAPLLLNANCITEIYSYENGILECAQTSNNEIPNEITVGSYNILGLKHVSALKEDLKELRDVSIWAFQEVSGRSIELVPDKLLQVLPEGKWYIYIQIINNQKSTTNWEGQAIISRYPFQKVERVSLNHTDSKKRVALAAYYSTNSGNSFLFVNTDHEVNFFGISFADRSKQLKSLIDYTSQFAKNPILITGDMNTTGGSYEIGATEKLMATASYSRALPLPNESATFQMLFISTELDHIFYRNLNSSRRFRYSNRIGSDHFPIFADIKL